MTWLVYNTDFLITWPVYKAEMSRVMRKPAFCICENKDADQLRGNREADQRLFFRYIDSTIPLLSKSKNFKPVAIFCSCTAWFVSEQVRNQNVGFLMNAQMENV